jgi:hypothetical protein
MQMCGMFSPPSAETAFGLDSDELMTATCSNLSDLAFEMELHDDEMLGALPSHASACSETSSAPTSPLCSALPESRARQNSPMNGISTFATFSEMESKLQSLAAYSA